jgi:hypothetical protein
VVRVLFVRLVRVYNSVVKSQQERLHETEIPEEEHVHLSTIPFEMIGEAEIAFLQQSCS